MAAASEALLVVWAVHPAGGWYPELVLRGHAGSVGSVDVTPDGSQIVSGSSDGSVRLWDAQSGTQLAVLHQLEGAGVMSVRISPDAARIVYGSGAGRWSETGVGVLAREGSSPRLFEPTRETAHVVSWSPAGDRIAHSEGQYGSIVLRTAPALASERSLQGSGSPVFRVGSTRSGMAWDDTRERRGWGELDTTSLVVREGISDRRVVSGYPDRRVRAVRLNLGETGVVAVDGFIRLRASVSFLPLLAWSLLGHSRLGIGSEGGLHLIELEANVQRDCLGHESLVNSVSPFAGGSLVLTGSADQTLRLWEASTCRERLDFYHDERGDWVAWTPEGYFASSPGGELLLGMHQNRGAREAPTFEPIAAELRRGDLVSASLLPAAATGSEAAR